MDHLEIKEAIKILQQMLDENPQVKTVDIRNPYNDKVTDISIKSVEPNSDTLKVFITLEPDDI